MVRAFIVGKAKNLKVGLQQIIDVMLDASRPPKVTPEPVSTLTFNLTRLFTRMTRTTKSFDFYGLKLTRKTLNCFLLFIVDKNGGFHTKHRIYYFHDKHTQ